MKKKINSIVKDFSQEQLIEYAETTPVFVFSKRKIVANYKEYKMLFSGALIKYAMKANSEPELLQILADEGCGFEVASIGELEILKKLKVPADKLIYGSSVKPVSSIEAFHEYGVDIYAFDSFQELEKIAAVAPNSKVYVRMRANDSGSVFKFSEKFGTEIENIVPLLISAKGLGLIPYGISFHVGSQAHNPKAWAFALKKLKPVVKKLLDIGIKLEVIDIGGGYPCQYESEAKVPSLEDISKHTYAQLKRFPYELKIMMEPGRGMVADTAFAIANIIARVERKGNTWLFLDLGVYNGLFEVMAYQGSTIYPISSFQEITDDGEAVFELAGPTGDSPDVITRKALLPTDIGMGERIIIHNVGAYSLAVTSNFNGFSKPKVMFV